MQNVECGRMNLPAAVSRAAALFLTFLVFLGGLRFAHGSVPGGAPLAATTLRIVRQPESFQAAGGGRFALSVDVESNKPLTYQWKLNGVPLDGEAGPALQRSELTEENAGTYAVDVSNGGENVTSAGAVVRVLEGAPVVLGQTPSQSVTVGSRRLLRVYVREASSVTYQWRKGGVAIPGATGPTYLLDAVEAAAAGRYDVLLKNATGTSQSAPIVLSVVAAASPDFSNPIDRWLDLGEVVSAGLDSPESSLALFGTADLAVDSSGNLFIAESGSHVIRRITPNGVSSIVAGKLGEAGFADGTGEAARFDSPEGIALDSAGNLYVADSLNNTVRKVTPQGQVSTVAGQANVPLEEGSMFAPRKVAVDSTGSVYVLDASTVRKVLPNRGTEVIPWGGLAPDSLDPYPTAIEVDADGRLFVAAVDSGSSRLFVRGPNGFLSPLQSGDSADGDAFSPGVIDDLFFGPGRRLYACSEITGAVFHFGQIAGTAPSSLPAPDMLLNDDQNVFSGTPSVFLPRAFALDSSGALYLADQSLQTVLVGIPDGLPALAVQPAPVACKVDEPFALRVGVEGGRDVSLQWLRNGVPIEGATQPVFSVEKARISDSGSYSVEVLSRSGRVVSRTATVAVTLPGPSLSVLVQPGNEGAQVKFFKGSAASLKTVLNFPTAEVTSTEFRIHSWVNGAVGPALGISGIVPASGELTVPLRALTASGNYVIRFTRRLANQETLEADSNPFQVELLEISKEAGTYEVLLRDASNGLIGDDATYRGNLTVTVSKTGAVSGRIFYNEAPSFKDAPEGVRAYTCVVRSFSSLLVPSPDNPLKLVCAPKVGVGSSANRQKIQIELDFSGARAELSAVLTDMVSASTPEGCVSQGAGGLRCLTSLSAANVGDAAGRYVLSADAVYQEDGPVENNLAQVFVQVLPTGRVLWTTNLPGYAGSGSAGLASADAETLTAQFYEGRSSMSSKSLSTNSLLGILRIGKADGSTWFPSIVGEFGEAKLERHSTFITRALSSTPFAYVEDAFATYSNWSRAKGILFDFGEGCNWKGSTVSGLAAFLWPGSAAQSTPFELSLNDPITAEPFTWKVTVSPTGLIKAAPSVPGALQPVLTLRLDRTRGQWSGSYSWSGSDVPNAPKAVRRNWFGASVQTDGNPSLRAKGWLEVGALPATKTASWQLVESE
jgi:hypothetical protein